MSSRRSSRRSATVRTEAVITNVPSSMSSRPRRSVSDNNPVMASVFRSPLARSPHSMRLTVKTSSSKLREATRANASDDDDDAEEEGDSIAVNTARDPFIGGRIIEGKRNRTVRKSYVLDSDSEDEEDEDEEMDDVADDDEDEDAEGEDEDEDMDAEDDGLGDEDAEGEEIDVDAPPPPPVIKISKAQSGRQTTTVKAPPAKGNMMAVEQKEMANGSDDDEELSELDSEVGVEDEEEEEVEEEDEEDVTQIGNEEDAEGEDEEIEVVEEEEEEEEDEEMDSDDETPAGGSRATTPDISKLTKRQRARLVEGGSGHLLALPDEVQVKKHLTAEEHAMRRAEMARRRKNLSEKRNEEEKMETINKLLKKQAPKTSSRRKEMANAGDVTPDSELQKSNPLFVRWISNKDGNRICVPEEWLDKPVGSLFQNTVPARTGLGGKLIEEV
ncbi:hypothetical protein B7463_g10605, partial [Scytalidium lignicola]